MLEINFPEPLDRDERAIVSEEAGTTRDLVVSLIWVGLPFI